MDAAKELAGEIGPYVLNYITKGKFETDDEIWKAQLKNPERHSVTGKFSN